MSGAFCAQKIDLAGRKSWCESNDPESVAKAADVVGLYMAPPENAIVIPSVAGHLIGAGVDHEVRGWEKASNHAPA